jgi:hypothetical protein
VGRRQPDTVRRLNSLVDEWKEWKTADLMADYLRAQGVRGQRLAVSSCPLARWARRCIPEAQHVLVTSGSVWITYCERSRWLPWRQVRRRAGTLLPEGARWFISAFDRGEYPDLVEKPHT